ncbi:MAG: cupin [Candidatus Gracilibacteria bacterium]|jgi:quercetin dioxygenase-like cupin family protein
MKIKHTKIGHPKVILKPWGREIWFANQKEYAGKILVIEKGHRYSLQYHERKKETQYLLSGKIKLSIGDEKSKKTVETGSKLRFITLLPGDSIDILPGTIHRAEALRKSRILEVSTNDLDDVVKLDDDYGRSGKGNNFKLDTALAKRRKK